MKKCIRCEQTKSMDEFNNKSNSKDGKQTYCRSCQSVKKLEWATKSFPMVSIIYGVYMKDDPDYQLVYVGESTESMGSRKSKHKHSAYTPTHPSYNCLFQQAIREHGWDAFGWLVLVENYSEILTEDYFIKAMSPIYNSRSGNTSRTHRFACEEELQDYLNNNVCQA